MDSGLTRVPGGTLPKYPTGSEGSISLDSMGNVINCDWIQHRINSGYGFNFANITPDTTITGTVNYAATTPCILLSIPTGYTMVPFYINISIEDSAGTDNHILVGCDASDLYSSGGSTAGSALNCLRTSGGGTSAATGYNGKTAIVMTDPTATERSLFHWCNAFADANTEPPRVVTWQPQYPPVLIGPSTLYVYVYSASTAMEFEYSVQWVEFLSTSF